MPPFALKAIPAHTVNAVARRDADAPHRLKAPFNDAGYLCQNARTGRGRPTCVMHRRFASTEIIDLELLARGPEQDLVHVHLLRLAHGEGDCPRERFGRNCNRIDLADVLSDIRLGHAVRQFRGYRTR